ncbi:MULTISPECIES: phage tail assembly protein [Pseudomonas]|uniref:Phage tail assembly protein n=1 Tax=Pseudomonas wuhanensis TaxID=2954098 RepID=A0ABY9GWR5_9PSED|nr:MULTISPECIES: phage tail assembly protein [unclassified Pseudomonas]WLI14349.1 phage tail assembly protein [Pseudomonas sp. FP603]WLI20265.1 phage tail assembly protein [Pseudomonas sp. FP607]
MTQTTLEKPLPKWLQLTEEGFRISLKYPTELSGVLVDTLAIRAPCVRDVRAAQATCNGDEEKREMSLFSSLTQTPEADLMALKLVDYMRLQAGYFRLVTDD